MAKQKKKRNKQYTGRDAASARPAVTRIAAVNRSKSGQWFYERKRVIKIAGIAALILFALFLVIIGIAGLLR